MFKSDYIVHIAIKAALSAGKEIMSIYESDSFQITVKEDYSPLTIADRNSHDIILDILKETGIPVLSEEGKHMDYQIRKNWDYFWLVDPLDGTKEFIKRNGEFTVNIALISKDKPVAGIIYVPVTKTLYFSGIGQDAYKVEQIEINKYNNLNELLSESKKLPLDNFDRPYTVVGSRSHLSKETEKFFNTLKEKHVNIEFLSVGSSLKQCMVAEGRADLYPRFGPTMEWDTGAGHAIVEASGGTVSQFDGSVLVYNKENLLNPDFIVKSNRLV